MIKPGDGIPYFELGGVDDNMHSPDEWEKKKVLVILFTCNHCPYVQAYEDRMIQLQEHFGVQGVQLVCINSNDDSVYPDDNLTNMKKRAKEKKFNFPYLRDRSQVVAHKFGAQVTPEAFVFDKKRTLQYHGRIDDNWRDEKGVKEKNLFLAISDVLSGKTPSKQEVPALGCSVKWK